jgi:aspartate oxidase
MELIKFLMDIVIIGLLGAGVYYAIKLEKQLKVLRLSQAEMGRYTADFSRNIDRAEAGIKSLKLTAREAGDDLEKLLERGQVMRDELRFVVDHADSLVDKIAKQGAQMAAQSRGVESQRMGERADKQGERVDRGAERPVLRAVSETPTAEKAVVGGEPRSRAERELLHALKNIQE